MSWGFGDGSTLTVVDSPYGRIGWVGCWENYMPDAVLTRGGSAMISPLGEVLAGPRFDEETILTAGLDLRDIGRAKFDFDVAGHNSRPDVFQRTFNETPMVPVS